MLMWTGRGFILIKYLECIFHSSDWITQLTKLFSLLYKFFTPTRKGLMTRGYALKFLKGAVPNNFDTCVWKWFSLKVSK